MTDLAKAVATQMANIEKRSGRSLADLMAFGRASGLTRHGEIRDLFKRELGLGHGDANLLARQVVDAAGTPDAGAATVGSAAAAMPPAASPGAQPADPAEAADAFYTGARAALRPAHDAVMAAVLAFGPFEIAPKKGYLSLRRSKQFAMVGPATNTRIEVGLNMKGVPPTERLQAVPPGGMCPYKVKLASAAEVDAELVAWLRRAFDAAA